MLRELSRRAWLAGIFFFLLSRRAICDLFGSDAANLQRGALVP